MSENRLYSTEELLLVMRKNREAQVQRAKRGELGEDEEYDWAVGLMCSGELDSICTTTEFKSIDDCSVEIDGNCPHGYKSPLSLLSLV